MRRSVAPLLLGKSASPSGGHASQEEVDKDCVQQPFIVDSQRAARRYAKMGAVE
jgi:hypothetical protein